jgi:alpha-tubulin suppressor-like RCC1 family protein
MNHIQARFISIGIAAAGVLIGTSAVAAQQHRGVVGLFSGQNALSTCAFLADNRFQCWGSLFSGLQDVADSSRISAVSIGGDNFACALKNDRTVECWGSNRQGQLGDGTTSARTTPVLVIVNSGGILQNVAQISAGFSHVCALKTDGTVWCWGGNGFGQIGNFNVAAVFQPTAVQVLVNDGSADPLGSVEWITSGGNHTCAQFLPDVHGARTGACWGYNAYGQLGDGAISRSENSPVTIEVPGPSGPESLQMNAKTLTAGERHTCTMIGDTAACWGDNSEGATSTGIGGNSPTPATVIFSDGTPASNITSLTTGKDFSCLVFSDKTGACWGENAQGQIGNYELSLHNTDQPAAIELVGGAKLQDIDQIVTGYTHGCALLSDKHVYCWGDNTSGQVYGYPYSYTDVPVETADGPIFTDNLEGG